jgi:hypothetical protein
MAPPGPVSGPDAQHAVAELLRRAEYHRDDPGLLARLGNWLLDRLDALFSGGTGSNVLLVLLALVAAVVVLATVRAGLPQRRSRPRTDGDPLRPDTTADHRRLAESLAAAGDSAGALREWLRAAVQVLEERGVLLPRPGRTATAAAREAAPFVPSAAAELAAAAAAFDQVWFGGRPATPGDVAAARAAADAVLAAGLVPR